MAKRAREVKEVMAKDNPERAERLAAALRDNLKRRKAQARERNTETPQQRESDSVNPPTAPSPD